ncbi:MAG TPA: hypothetical protein VE093_02095 [Polyangiaceae bacterium]|nr:hypothetical protein [Polyangiaceae bacterium]
MTLPPMRSIPPWLPALPLLSALALTACRGATSHEDAGTSGPGASDAAVPDAAASDTTVLDASTLDAAASKENGAGLSACKERRPAITAGVYGCVTTSNDVGPPSVAPLAAFTVEIFAAKPPPKLGEGPAPLAKAISDEVGFYEIPLEPGAYWICTSFRRCAAVTVEAGKAKSKNYEMGVGPGW